MPKKPQQPAQPQPELIGSQKAYEDALPDAQSLAEDDVLPFRADASLAYHNAKRGIDAVLPHVDRIQSELPTVDIAKLEALPDLALAVIHAAAQVDRSSDGSTPALLEKARFLREILIKSADALAAAGVLPARAVDKIHEGRGLIDIAQDNVDLAALFTKYQQVVKGKTAVTTDQIEEAATIGTDLLKRLKPKGTKSQDPAIDAVKVRDRMWTLLVTRQRELRRVGMWLWLDDVDQHVPALQSRRISGGKNDKKAAESK